MNILDHSFPALKSAFIEASAGTGKTFAMEHLTVRALLSGIPLEQILIVTFTNAAADDLLQRVHSCLLARYKECTSNESSIDYMQHHLKQNRDKAARRLLKAIHTYDRARIETIHSFCMQELKEREFLPEEENLYLTKEEQKKIIREVLQRKSSSLTQEQYLALTRHYYRGQQYLENALMKAIEKAALYMPARMFSEAVDEIKKRFPFDLEEGFQNEWEKLGKTEKNKYEIEANLLLDVFARKHVQDTDVEQMVARKMFGMTKIKNQSFMPYIRRLEVLTPLLEEIGGEQFLFATLAADCQKQALCYMQKQEKLRFDDLILRLLDALKSEAFLKEMQARYRLILIDEFQDTDERQWEIFQKISEPLENTLIIVGDPKQSIYSFRQADLNTYLQAKEQSLDFLHHTLDVNYRSDPRLVAIFNALFGYNSTLFHLPNRSLSYVQNRAGIAENGRANAPLYVVEVKKEELLYCFIGNEIARWSASGMPLCEIAVLVRSRNQGKKIASYLRRRQIPCCLNNDSSLVETQALRSVRSLLEALLDPSSIKLLKRALGERLFGWNLLEIASLSSPEKLAPVLERFRNLSKKLFDDGFAALFEHLIEQELMAQAVLGQHGGEQFYDDLQYIANLLAEHERRSLGGPEGVLRYLLSFLKMDSNDDPEIKKPIGSSKNAISIVTIHTSKGLEYEVVIPIGIGETERDPEAIIPQKINGQLVLQPVHRSSDAYLEHKLRSDAEQMRLFYVALTRAKSCLYLPLLTKKDSMLANYLKKIGGVEGLKDALQQTSYEWMIIDQMPIEKPFVPIQLTLLPPPSVSILSPRKYLQSFTGLSRHESIAKDGVPHTLSIDEKSVHAIPGGAEFGLIFHAIMEKIDFSRVSKAALSSFIPPKWKQWEETLLSLAISCSRIPLFGKKSLFDCPKDCFIREMEFVHPLQANERILDKSVSEGYLRGFIDLIAFVDQKAYIIDWKTNWLGPDASFYKEDFMQREMVNAEYLLQGEIYKNALRRYWEVLSDRPFDEAWGGMYYIFVRGLEDGGGIYKIAS